MPTCKKSQVNHCRVSDQWWPTSSLNRKIAYLQHTYENLPEEAITSQRYVTPSVIPVKKFGEAQNQGRRRAFSKGSHRVRMCFFHNIIICYFVFYQDQIEKILLQLFMYPKIQNGFLYFLLSFLRSTALLMRNKYKLVTIFVFYKFALPSRFIDTLPLLSSNIND